MPVSKHDVEHLPEDVLEQMYEDDMEFEAWREAEWRRAHEEDISAWESWRDE